MTREDCFFFTKDEKDLVRKVNFHGRTNSKKFLEMVAYLFELGYDLAISKRHNVLNSPGFEGCSLFN